MGLEKITDDGDALDFSAHSVWLSPSPCTSSSDWGTFYVPRADQFFFLGGDAELNYASTYNASITGVYGKTYSDAYFVDGSSGCVCSLSLSCVRVQPPDFDDDSGNLNNISNARALSILRTMRGANTQLNQGAYVLRVGNAVMNMPFSLPRSDEDPSPRKGSGEGWYMEYYVFLNDYSVGYSSDAPNVLTISLSMTIRSPIPGFNLGTTQE